jgi:DNA-binding beta-propeller fold protein YncE
LTRRLCSSVRSGRPLLWLGIATVAALFTAGPVSAAPFVYVANHNGNSVSQFDVSVGGLLAPLAPPTEPAGGGPFGVSVSPDGSSVYVANGDASVSQYDVGAGGTLQPKSPPAVPANGTPFGIAMTPDGQSVYVTGGFGGGGVSQYDVGAGGALHPKSPPTVPAGHFPAGVAVSPDGQSVYVTNFDFFLAPDDDVFQYDVGSGGALTPKDPPTVKAGFGPAGVVVSPDGGSVYVANGLNDVSQYDVGPGGNLQPKDPPIVPAGSYPQAVAVSRDGESAYVTNYDPSVPGGNSVSQYDVGTGGALTPKDPPAVQAGSGATGLAVSPDGGSVYVANENGDNVSQYTAGPGGALQPKDPATVAAGDGPIGVAVEPAARLPTSIRDCLSGGWRDFGFHSAGDCIRFVIVNRICETLERRGHHPPFCPPALPRRF